MSRIGKMPVTIPKGVKAEVAGQLVKVDGPKGKLERNLRPEIEAKVVDGKILLAPKKDAPETKSVNAFHGLERALLSGMVIGVSEGYVKELELIGVGYRAEMSGKNLNLALGYSHPIEFQVPQNVKASVVKEGRESWVRLESADKQLIGETAAKIIRLRPPEPYKGKGIRFKGTVIKTKAGKAGKK